MKNKIDDSSKMGTYPIGKLLWSMSLPPVISMTLVGLYATLDAIWLGLLGEKPLTALTLALPITPLIIAFSVGTGNGCSSLVARKLGERNNEEANEIAKTGILLALANSLLFALIGLSFSRSFISLFTSDREIITMGSQYIFISCIFSFGIFIEVTCSRYFQAIGRTGIPMITQLVGALVNLVLDPLLIFGLFGFPNMGVAGAAASNVIGQIAAMLIALIMFLVYKSEISISLMHFKPRLTILKEIYKLALPNTAMLALNSIGVVLINAVVSGYSATAIATIGVFYKLQNQFEYILIGFSQAILPILSYNYGAKNKERFKSIYKISLATGLIIDTIGVILLILFTKPVLQVFSATPAMVEIGVFAIRIAGLSFLLNGVNFLGLIMFQSIGDAHYSFFSSLSKQILFTIPIAFVLSILIGLPGIWFSFPLGEIICTAIFIPISFRRLNKAFEINYNLKKEV